MRMNRRNVLVGLGTIVAGGGAALGTGAFSSVEADRTVDLGVNDDSDALLAIAEHEDGSAIVDDTADEGDAAVLTLDEQRLNENATTRFDQAITITNNGDRNVGFFVAADSAASATELDIEEFEADSIVGSENAVDLDANSGTVDLNVVIDLTDDNSVDNITGDITFEADEDEYNGQ